MKYLFIILFLSIAGYNQGQQIYFQKTYYEYTISCLGTDIIRVDSTNYLITGFYSYYNIPPGEFINRIDEYGNTLDSSILEPKRDSAGQIYELPLQHYFAEGLNGDYFSGLLIGDTVNDYRRYISMVKLNKNQDTLFQTELHSKVKPVDSLWPNAYEFYIPQEMQATLDGGLLIMAAASGLRQIMSVITKIDSTGYIEWEYKIKNDSLGGLPGYEGFSLVELPDSTYIAAYSTNEGTWDWSNHIILKKIDKNGNLLKTKSFVGGYENLSPIIRYNTLDSFIYLAYAKEYYGDDLSGMHTNYHKPNIMKLDNELNTIYNKFYGKPPYYIPTYPIIRHPDYYIFDFIIDDDGEMTILGNVLDHTSLVNHRGLIYLLKLDSNGDSLWFKAYDFPNISGNAITDYPYSSAVQNDDQGFTILTNILTSSYEFPFVFRVDSMGCPNPQCSAAEVIEFELPKNDIVVYPNPATTHITIDWQQPDAEPVSLQIYSSTGRLVQRFDAIRAGQELSVEQLSSGIYLLEGLTAKGQRFAGKFMKE